MNNLLPSDLWLVVISSLVFLLLGASVSLLFTHRWGSRSTAGKQAPVSQKRKIQQTSRANEDQLREIYKSLATMTASLNYQRVLDIALDMSMQALTAPGANSDRLVSAVLLFSQEDSPKPQLYIAASRRLTRSDMGNTFPGLKGLLHETLEEGGPTLSHELAKDPELGRVIALQSCQVAYCIPLRSGLQVYGVLLYAHPDGTFFAQERREVLDIIGNQANIAIQNARLYQDLAQEKERMMEIQEEARKKLARDLHDGPTQSIAAIAMRVNFARRLMERDGKAASEELFKIEDLARRTTKEIRHMLFTLRPLVLETQGLTAAFQSMAEKMKETYEQDVIVEVNDDIVNQLEMGKQGVIFYIAEEAVTNARKHAEAKHIWVRLKSFREELALLEIQDDGSGFDVHAVDAAYEHRGSLGMINMRERTELVNGIYNLESTPGKGTRVQVVIPLTEEAADSIRRGL
ncbi:MAG: GAF domain-containing sensor histidine kinase [Anaerolineales bacterium]|nr:GAF domain-containing sensor histidine kinase [Anaerolineales bacterium]